LDIINKSIKLKSNINNLINKINNKKSKYCIYCKNKNFNSKNHLEKNYFFKYPELRFNNNNKINKINKIKNKKPKSTKNNNNKYKNEFTKVIIKIKSIKPMIIIYKSNINNINNINKNQNKNFLIKFFKKIINKTFNNIIFDSGVIDHYCSNKNWLINYKTLDNKIFINTVIGEPCQILDYGDLPILIDNNKIFIIYIYYIFKLKNILINKYKLFLKK